MTDLYRVNLLKKKIREITDAPWLRFYWSGDRSHICLKKFLVGEENLALIMHELRAAGIEFQVLHWDHPWFEINDVRGISIPIDQEALPERRRRFFSKFALGARHPRTPGHGVGGASRSP